MDYSKLSDADINVEVGERLGWNAKFIHPDDSVTFRDDLGRLRGKKNYCNNPADAWPIIVANRIALMPDASEHGAHQWWDAQSSCRAHGIQYQANPLRAAMIVYLMMQESE